MSNKEAKGIPVVNRWVKEEEEEWEDPERKMWSLNHGFYKLMPGRYSLVCWKCHYEGHRAANCPTK